jgi:hypothetical protein
MLHQWGNLIDEPSKHKINSLRPVPKEIHRCEFNQDTESPRYAA